MAIAVINKTIELKNVKAQRGGDILRADRSWTAGNIQRQDLSGDYPVLEQWELTIIYNTKAEFDQVRNYLRSISYGSFYFWSDDLGGTAANDSIYVRADPVNYERVQFGNGAGWINNGRNFTIKLQEIPEVN